MWMYMYVWATCILNYVMHVSITCVCVHACAWCMCVCVCVCVCVYVHACMCTCMCACVRVINLFFSHEEVFAGTHWLANLLINFCVHNSFGASLLWNIVMNLLLFQDFCSFQCVGKMKSKRLLWFDIMYPTIETRNPKMYGPAPPKQSNN